MNRKDLKNYINNQIWIDQRIEKHKERRETINKLTSTLSDMPKGTPKTNDGFAEKLVALLDAEEEVSKHLEKEKALLLKIEQQLEKMENTLYRNLLYDHYILGNELVDFASKYSYDYDYVKHIHGWALNEFDELDT